MPERPHREAMLNTIASLRGRIDGERWQLEIDLLEKMIELATLEAESLAVTQFANSLHPMDAADA